MLYFLVFKNCAAFFSRTVLINSLGARSVSSLIFLYSLEELIPSSLHRKPVSKFTLSISFWINLVTLSINSSSRGEWVSILAPLSASPENFIFNSLRDLTILLILVLSREGSKGFAKYPSAPELYPFILSSFPERAVNKIIGMWL